MKKLHISLKTTEQTFDDFESVWNKLHNGEDLEPHYEISFECKKHFQEFIKHIDVLIHVLNDKPNSLYELSKVMGCDLSNLSKKISFLVDMRVLRIEETIVNNRTLKKPIVDFDSIEFRLRAA